MKHHSAELRDAALSIWQAAVASADPFALVQAALAGPELRPVVEGAGRILVVGGGKAGAAMAAGVEAALADRIERIAGVVNVPEGMTRSTRAVRLHAGRPLGVNHPTAEGVAGVREMLDLVKTAGPNDLGVCLLSGGGSALLPAPVDGVLLEDKQSVTALLHACGATIDEMNCVRKHLSRIKGGRLAQAFTKRGCPVYSLILSDVIGDPLDVIASGPTAADPTTFADALAVLERHSLIERAPPAVIAHAVWLYCRFALLSRDVAERLAERGVIVTYETVRQWCRTSGQTDAHSLRLALRGPWTRGSCRSTACNTPAGGRSTRTARSSTSWSSAAGTRRQPGNSSAACSGIARLCRAWSSPTNSPATGRPSAQSCRVSSTGSTNASTIGPSTPTNRRASASDGCAGSNRRGTPSAASPPPARSPPTSAHAATA